ncbi:asparagine synthase (glutamine-hydrolyzing) [Imperialibacter roseus]|uniref:asparagine synthase (glutamine-hydrolyzing) n=1 Tax=Imperialibacter roseus TaxID=1324217 RepID=A0ABZ0IMH6_9BACT|nr:asparagine synthase (glutamine-hydrolyzing) [Imperialibacter roseus]WOK06225.1 asparagine synthase (glutamine-hydrolyzing) [Imperialibacter roseus]
MCGITGIKAFNEVGRINMIHLAAATESLAKRGPDNQGLFYDHFVGLGHRRLSIIDVSESAHQPMSDASGRYQIVFNGEIFNYMQLRKGLQEKGVSFQTESDTEVLLQLYILFGKKALNHLNGFFAFAIFDAADGSLFIARDRLGIKPLYYYYDEDKLIFASEMKAIMRYGIQKELSFESLLTYLQLNYIPAPLTILKGVHKLPPGHLIVSKKNEVTVEQWYKVPFDASSAVGRQSYSDKQKELRELLTSAVKHRLVADVPLGTFLSGGTDSSIVAGIASKLHPGIHSFSIGYRDDPFFDETEYAELVARHFNTQHHVFKLSNDDLLNHLEGMISNIDEPFADSSALPVYILSEETRKHVTVALSGDGADELFGGYNKHLAWQKSVEPSFSNALAKGLLPLWKSLPASRSSAFGNKVRQLSKYGEGLKLSAEDRYWRWASYMAEGRALDYLSPSAKEELVMETYLGNKGGWLLPLHGSSSLNSFLLADTQLVLPDDMLTKVDRMSMANALEVRVPFLDHRVVEFAFGLPESFKIHNGTRKRILQDAFKGFLPQKLYNRPKKGFEVPLLKWMQNDMKSTLDGVVFNDDKLNEQGIFSAQQLALLRQQLHSNNPGDAHATTWALYVFQKWWENYFK